MNAPGAEEREAAEEVSVSVVPEYDHVYPEVTACVRLVEPMRKQFPCAVPSPVIMKEVT